MEAALQGLASYQPICLISNEALELHGHVKEAQHAWDDMGNMIRTWIQAKLSLLLLANPTPRPGASSAEIFATASVLTPKPCSRGESPLLTCECCEKSRFRSSVLLS